MFRIAFLIWLMSLLIAGAASAGISFPALVLMGSLTVIAFFVILGRSQQEE